MNDIADALLSHFKQFNELLTAEHADVQIAVHVHQDDGFADDSFHSAPCVVSLQYQVENPCGIGSLPGQTEVVMADIPFYSPGKTCFYVFKNNE